MEGLSEAYQDARFAGIVSGTVALWQSWHGGAFNWFTGGAETTKNAGRGVGRGRDDGHGE